ncbi:MAG TPA: hypothetical protein VK736_09705, partial [Candidatus Binatia bacterium]|nr:hypothetical protein [Candidatus Binatia bacterium]
MRSRPPFTFVVALAALATLTLPASWLIGRGGRRRPHAYGRELQKYRSEVGERTTRIDATLAT